jgi:hypothetical protein
MIHYGSPGALPANSPQNPQAREADNDHVECPPVPARTGVSDTPERARYSTTAHALSLSAKSTMENLPERQLHHPNPSENTPLLSSASNSDLSGGERRSEQNNYDNFDVFWEEFRVLTRYSLPVFGCAFKPMVSLRATYCRPNSIRDAWPASTQLLEYSLMVASVISIGHLSTTALAGVTLGSMTASVSGFSIIQGATSSLDTMLPSAWTSEDPKLVGLWSQRMGWNLTILTVIIAHSTFIAVVMVFTIMVCFLYV